MGLDSGASAASFLFQIDGVLGAPSVQQVLGSQLVEVELLLLVPALLVHLVQIQVLVGPEAPRWLYPFLRMLLIMSRVLVVYLLSQPFI